MITMIDSRTVEITSSNLKKIKYKAVGIYKVNRERLNCKTDNISVCLCISNNINVCHCHVISSVNFK